MAVPIPPTTPSFRRKRTRIGQQAVTPAAGEAPIEPARPGNSVDELKAAVSQHALEANRAAGTPRIGKRPTPRKVSVRNAEAPAVAVRSTTETMRLGNSVQDCVERTGICRSVIYADIAAGKLRARKRGSRTVILEDALLDYLRNLPDFHDAKSAVPGQRSKP